MAEANMDTAPFGGIERWNRDLEYSVRIEHNMGRYCEISRVALLIQMLQ